MTSFKRTIVAICLILFCAQAPLANSKPLSFQSVLERLLDNHRVVNIVDDFLVFWDQAKDKTPGVQRALWKRLVENKHRDYFDRAVYRTTDPKARRAMLDEFLIRVPSQVEAIRQFNKSISDLSTSPLVEAVIFFRARFREYQHQQDIYIGLSMFRFDGAVRPVQNDAGVPDTLCLGAEVLSSYTREQTRIAIAHEFFHLYHFGFLFQQTQNQQSDFRAAHVPLMIEGMAAAGAEEVFPYQPRELYLHFDKEELAAQEQELPQSAGQFLDLVRWGAAPEKYEPWFTKSHVGDAPSRGGYLLGYEVTRRLMSSYTFEQMVRMTPAELREHAEEELAAISNERILLMASH
jgi:Predicted Zn-dependent protease (DUF2268)